MNNSLHVRCMMRVEIDDECVSVSVCVVSVIGDTVDSLVINTANVATPLLKKGISDFSPVEPKFKTLNYDCQLQRSTKNDFKHHLNIGG